MNVDIGKIFAAMFGLILVFLLLSRSSEFVSILKAAGGVLTQQTAQLQGVGTAAGGTTIIQGSNGGSVWGSLFGGAI